MDSVRKGLRAGDVQKGTYDRLECGACGVTLKTRSEEDMVGVVRVCPDCDREWQEVR